MRPFASLRSVVRHGSTTIPRIIGRKSTMSPSFSLWIYNSFNCLIKMTTRHETRHTAHDTRYKGCIPVDMHTYVLCMSDMDDQIRSSCRCFIGRDWRTVVRPSTKNAPCQTLKNIVARHILSVLVDKEDTGCVMPIPKFDTGTCTKNLR